MQGWGGDSLEIRDWSTARGLRTADPAEYPGVVKEDCLVLDFGRSLLTHNDLESKVQMEDRQKLCPECGAEIPLGVMECPICGCIFRSSEAFFDPAASAGVEPEQGEPVSAVRME